MRKHLILAAVSVAALIPSLAMAQETCEQRSANRAAGTVGGAVVGALLGSAIGAHGHKGDGAIVGGVGGAIVGNQLAKGDRDCTHAYGWYDNDGRWHANSVDRSVASGYYDRSGAWIEGEPHGYYDSRGVWVASAGTYGANASYETRRNVGDLDARIARLDARIDNDRRDGSLSRREARDAMNTLNDIRRDERYRLSDGRLGDNDVSMLWSRLDRLSSQIRYND
jgi:hypothetical protein